jgi:hypothetical protein
MSNKRIKYICYYDTIDSSEERGYSMAAINKLNYIFSTLNSNGIGIDIISMSGATGDSCKLYFASKKNIGINTLKLFMSFSTAKNIHLLKRINYVLLNLQLFLYLLFHTRRNEEIIVYHSLGYVRMLNTLKHIKNFSIVGEIEEIYQDVVPCSQSVCQAEYLFFDLCDKYIFPTKLHILSRSAKDYATKRMTDDAMTSSLNPAIDGAVAPLINIIYIYCIY